MIPLPLRRQGAQALAMAGWSVGLEGFSMAINTLPPCSVLLPHVHGMATEFIVVLNGAHSPCNGVGGHVHVLRPPALFDKHQSNRAASSS